MIEKNEKVQYVLKTLPTSSGVYLMKDATGKIIYIGKAKNLKNRVTSYFVNTKKNLKTTLLVDKIRDIEYFLTASEQDAFSLENNLIKQHKPKYNILLKDDKWFPYIRIDKNEKFPQLKVVRRVKPDGALYFGPFMTGIRVSELMAIIKLVFPVRSCAKDLSKVRKNHRPCLFYDLGKCVAPCSGCISNEEYQKIIDKVIDFLNGKDGEVKRLLTKKMNECAEKMDFEQAIDYRTRLELLEKRDEKVLSSLQKDSNFDCFAICGTDDENFAIVKNVVRNGKTIAETSQLLDSIETEPAVLLEDYILEYYQENSMPTEVLVNMEISCEVGNLLSEQAGKKILVHLPKIGIKKKIVDQAEKNAHNYLDKNLDLHKNKQKQALSSILRLQEVLGLSTLPNRIECYDISNISGVDSVSSMVVFEKGVSAPKEYRKFKIKTVTGPNDFASMAETLTRRLKRLNEDDSKFNKTPDLILIDGGPVQLQYAQDAMKALGFDIPMVSLAERFEEIYTLDRKEPIRLSERDEARKLLQRIRDEAHRFAITFHRTLHQKNMFN